MRNIKLSQTDLDLLKCIANNQKCLENPVQYPYAKPFSFNNMPIKNYASPLFGTTDEYYTSKDAYSLYDWCMIEVNPVFCLSSIGKAYLDFITIDVAADK